MTNMMSDFEDRQMSAVNEIRCSYSGYQLIQQNFGTDMNRSWVSYQKGFGNTTGTYWIGNDALHNMTKNNTCRLMVVLQSRTNSLWYQANYSYFMVESAVTFYKVHISGFVGGNASDSLSALGSMNSRPFSTYEADHDNWNNNCAAECGGGWWYGSCNYAILNGGYPAGGAGHQFSWYYLPPGSVLNASRIYILC